MRPRRHGAPRGGTKWTGDNDGDTPTDFNYGIRAGKTLSILSPLFDHLFFASTWPRNFNRAHPYALRSLRCNPPPSIHPRSISHSTPGKYRRMSNYDSTNRARRITNKTLSEPSFIFFSLSLALSIRVFCVTIREMDSGRTRCLRDSMYIYISYFSISRN